MTAEKAPVAIETRLMWGMPVTVEIVTSPPLPPSPLRREGGERKNSVGLQRPWPLQTNEDLSTPPLYEVERGPGGEVAPGTVISRIFGYFAYIDDKFSTYKPDSEIALINAGALALEEASLDMRTVIALGEAMRLETGGYFDIHHDGKIDPLGLVKGWALSNAAEMIREAGYANFFVEAGGDFQADGLNPHGEPWKAGIRSPFNIHEIVKVLSVSSRGMATSGTYIRGQHIYDPVDEGKPAPVEVLSITVIGPDVYEADCYATAAFAMGREGIRFIESLEGFEGYMIDSNHTATFTSGFERYVDHAEAYHAND